jgi:hypothetical protein
VLPILLAMLPIFLLLQCPKARIIPKKPLPL